MAFTLGLGSHAPVVVPDVIKITVSGCQPAAGGVGIDLTQQNVILEIRPETAASRAIDAGVGLQVGDRVLSVDGVSLRGRILTQVIQPADVHEFEVERVQGWSGFSIDTEVCACANTITPLSISNRALAARR